MNHPAIKQYEILDGKRVEMVAKYTETSACPECGHKGPHDDNCAPRLADLTYWCVKCETFFDAVPY